MYRKQVILFDLDGTLTDPGIGITNGARKGLERLAFRSLTARNSINSSGLPCWNLFRSITA